jgi:hypothetical protein
VAESGAARHNQTLVIDEMNLVAKAEQPQSAEAATPRPQTPLSGRKLSMLQSRATCTAASPTSNGSLARTSYLSPRC